MNFQNVLNALKKDHKLTDAKIAAEVGLSQATITRLRNGDLKQPRYDKGLEIIRLANEFGIEV